MRQMSLKGSSKTSSQHYLYSCHWRQTSHMSVTCNKEVWKRKDLPWEVMCSSEKQRFLLREKTAAGFSHPSPSHRGHGNYFYGPALKITVSLKMSRSPSGTVGKS